MNMRIRTIGQRLGLGEKQSKHGREWNRSHYNLDTNSDTACVLMDIRELLEEQVELQKQLNDAVLRSLRVDEQGFGAFAVQDLR